MTPAWAATSMNVPFPSVVIEPAAVRGSGCATGRRLGGVGYSPQTNRSSQPSLS